MEYIFAKSYLFENRLAPLLKSKNFNSFTSLIDDLRQPVSKEVHDCLIDAMTTKETSFFRDSTPFSLLKFKLIPDHFEKGGAITLGLVEKAELKRVGKSF